MVKHLAKILQWSPISFLISQQSCFVGTIIPILQKTKTKNWESERFKCHVEVTTVGHWKDLKVFHISSIHDCCQHRLKLTLCTQWMQSWSPWTLLESESKEHTCQALRSVLRWEYVQRLKAEPWGIWKYRWEEWRQGLWVLPNFGNEGSGGFLTVFKYFTVWYWKKWFVPLNS